MKVDISHFGMRVVLQNSGDRVYSAYPRDIEGTILSVYVTHNKEINYIKEGNYRALFDIEDTIVKILVRWDNDTKGVYSTHNLHIRDFGRCPGLQSIWSNSCYIIDNRPYQELKPMTKPHIKKDLLSEKFINNMKLHAEDEYNIEYNIDLPPDENDIDLSDIVEDMEPMELPKPKKAKIKQRTYGSYNTYNTTTINASSTTYYNNYNIPIGI